METAALPTTRADIFRLGLKAATGTITFWRGDWGTVRLDGHVPVEYFVHVDFFPANERADVGECSRLIFDVEPGQVDMKTMDLPEGTQRRKAKVCNCRLINFNR